MSLNHWSKFFIFLICWLSITGASAQSGWVLKKDKFDIKVYTRPIEGSSLDEFRGVVEVNASIDHIVSLFKKVEEMPKWVPDCKNVRLIELKDNTQIHYTETQVPFPLKNRDAIVRYEYQKEGKNTIVRFEGIPDFEPKSDNLVRIPYLKGEWLLAFIDTDKTRVTYQVHADPGGSIPAWLANATAVDNPFETLKNLRSYFE